MELWIRTHPAENKHISGIKLHQYKTILNLASNEKNHQNFEQLKAEILLQNDLETKVKNIIKVMDILKTGEPKTDPRIRRMCFEDALDVALKDLEYFSAVSISNQEVKGNPIFTDFIHEKKWDPFGFAHKYVLAAYENQKELKKVVSDEIMDMIVVHEFDTRNGNHLAGIEKEYYRFTDIAAKAINSINVLLFVASCPNAIY